MKTFDQRFEILEIKTEMLLKMIQAFSFALDSNITEFEKAADECLKLSKELEQIG